MTHTVAQYQPPGDLSERSRALWHSLVPSHANSPGRLALLTEALRSLDRADAAREGIATAGMTCTTTKTGAMHLNPLTRVERESRQLFARIMGDLQLVCEPSFDGL